MIDGVTEGTDFVAQMIDGVTEGIDFVAQMIDGVTEGTDFVAQMIDGVTEGTDFVAQMIDCVVGKPVQPAPGIHPFWERPVIIGGSNLSKVILEIYDIPIK